MKTQNNKREPDAIGRILEACYANPQIISFAGGIPDADLFPLKEFQTALRNVADDEVLLRSSLQYSNRYGYEPLREWIASHMCALGVKCRKENILITSGSQQLLDLAGKLYVPSGATLSTAPAAYFAALQAFAPRDPVYDTQLHENLEKGAAFQHPKYTTCLAYFVPDFDNPTGKSLDLARRKKIVDLAEENDFYVLEDAAYASVRFEGDALPSLLELDISRAGGDINATRVIYAGTFSKSLVPGARVGWACAAKSTIDALANLRYPSDIHSPLLTQIAVHRVAESIFRTHLKKICAAYKGRRDLMLTALKKHMPKEATWQGTSGGMFVWMDLPSYINTKTLAWTALKSGVAFAPGQDFSPHDKPSSGLRLCFSWLDRDKIDLGIKILADVIRQEITLQDKHYAQR